MWKSEWTVKWRLKELLAGVFGSTVIHWLAVGGLVNSKDPFSVLYLARVTRDFIPAKPSTMRAEAHFLCIKLSYYVFLLIQMYVLHCLFYFICKDIIWIFNTIIPVHDLFWYRICFERSDGTQFRVRSHFHLYSEMLWAKSSHLNRNPCNLEFCVSDIWTFQMQISHCIQVVVRFILSAQFGHIYQYKAA